MLPGARQRKTPEVTSLGYTRDCDGGNGADAVVSDVARRSPLFYVGKPYYLKFTFDLCEFGKSVDPEKMEFKASRSLDLSRDCRRVVMADDEVTRSRRFVFELGNIPDLLARDVNQRHRKAIGGPKTTNSSTSSPRRIAQRRRKDKVTPAHRMYGTPWKQAVIGMLTNWWTPAWAIKDAKAVAAWQRERRSSHHRLLNSTPSLGN